METDPSWLAPARRLADLWGGDAPADLLWVVVTNGDVWPWSASRDEAQESARFESLDVKGEALPDLRRWDNAGILMGEVRRRDPLALMPVGDDAAEVGTWLAGRLAGLLEAERGPWHAAGGGG